MLEKRVKISSILNNQLPEFVRSEFPLLSEFLDQYYKSLESRGNPYDLMNNIDQYVKVDNISNLINSTTLTANVDFFDTVINVESTAGFVDNYGLIQINNEIISYESKTETTFENCYRGFSGVTSYNTKTSTDELTFSQSETAEHSSDSIVNNLNTILLSEFFKKVKTQITPGFENRSFSEDLNESLFVKQSNNFYSSKGTDESFKILFGALYGKPVEIILPKEYLLEPSASSYRITKDLVVEKIQGNPLDLENRTLFNLDGSSGTVTSVEEIEISNLFRDSVFLDDTSELSSEALTKVYYLVSIDFDYDKDIETRGTTTGNFHINPKTRLVTRAFSGDTHLDVDSTLGFPSSGQLIINQPNGSIVNITYQSKSINQFFDCEGINQTINQREEVKDTSYSFAIDGDDEIRVRITGVISEFEYDDNSRNLRPGDVIKSSSLGKSDLDSIKFDSWIYNVSSSYEIESIIALEDTSDNTYRIKTYDVNDFNIGDKFELTNTNATGVVQSINNENTLVIRGQGEIPKDSTGNFIFTSIRKLISKPEIVNYPELSIYNSNVSNTYYDRNDESVYVTSPSLPNYNNTKIRITDLSAPVSSFNKHEINLNVSASHSFLTGDLVILKSSNFQEIGYVKRINEKIIKIARNKESIISNTYLDFSDHSPVGVKVEFFKFNELNPETNLFESKLLQPQKLIRKLQSPINTKEKNNTITGQIGLFINGVEIQNYKSEDNLYYGEIKSIEVTSSGIGYDVINPPELFIDSSSGSGAVATASVSGSLERIDVINSGFNYSKTPRVVISGGNGSGAIAEANLIQYEYSKSLIVNTQSISGNQITFEDSHNFSDLEEVIYDPGNNPTISGLSTNSTYYVKVVGITTIKLYSTETNFSTDNFISVASSGDLGSQSFRSKLKKRKVSSINVIDSGSGYTNKELIAFTSKSQINIVSDTISIKNHGFKYREKIVYTANGSTIGGLSTNTTYFVNPIDSDTFRLYDISLSGNEDFLLETDQYIDLTSTGGEEHVFNYPPIIVDIIGDLQIPALNQSSVNFECQIQPVVRGEIKSIFVKNSGIQYGNQEIINYQEQPNITFKSGKNGDIGLTIEDGRITSAFVLNPGVEYNSPPTLVVNGDGRGAVLVPIIQSGSIIDVVISSSGTGYTNSNTSVDVLSAGEEAKLSTNIQSWNILTPKRYPSILSIFNTEKNSDDGYLISGPRGGLQYTHFYASRPLRSQLLSTYFDNGVKSFISDILSDNIQGTNILAHSGIIGWAYDGNPIYGPYAYTNTDGTGGIKLISSGYSLKVSSSSENRPSASEFGLSFNEGFFLEDYEFNNSGDLDEHNGRFCVTPEFPNGVYAYFSTFESELNGDGNRVPAFPYLIGNTYKSSQIEFNFDFTSNQDQLDISTQHWLRNTKPYNEDKDRSTYDYFLNSSDLNIDTKVKSVISGKIDNLVLKIAGDGYKVGDNVILTDRKKKIGEVSKISGKSIESIGISSIISIQDVELYKKNSSFYVGYSTLPHNIVNGTNVNVFSPSESPQYLKVNVNNNSFRLSSGISSITDTGISTYISVSGNLLEVKENDIYRIENEDIKILSVDFLSSRFRILRAQNGTSGLSTYSSGSILTENPRKFILNYKTSNTYNLEVNKEIYFNPTESVGIGSSFGVGITSTLYFSNPGAGNTLISIPTRAIYLPKHELKNGDLLSYSSNIGDSIEVLETSSGVSTSLSSFDSLYATKFTNDTIGLSTLPVGLNSLGNYAGIGTIPANLLFFTGIGTNTYHSLKTTKNNVLTTELLKNVVNVSLAESHGLSLLSTVDVEVLPANTKTVVVKYNDTNRRFVVDPLNVSSVDLVDNTVTINNHQFIFGEKVLFEKTSGFDGLVNENLYYVTPVDSNSFKLSTNLYNLNNKIYVDLTSTGTEGVVSNVNPEIELIEYQKLKFDLSDSSLSYSTGGSSLKSAFELELFFDENFLDKIYPANNTQYKLTTSGEVGVDSDANLSIEINSNTKKKLFYKLSPILTGSNSTKKELIVDKDQIKFSTINLISSKFNGLHEVTNVGVNTFSYELQNYPEKESYTSSEATFKYSTTNTSLTGPISELVLKNKTIQFSSIPKLYIESDSGKDGYVYASSNTIGKVKDYYFDSIGFNYSIDPTIIPSAKIPTILEVNALSVFDRIEILTSGFSYTTDTDLVVIDGLTNKIVNDVKLEYIPSKGKVNILKNTSGINQIQPKIIPISNSNGLKIRNVTYDPALENVTVTLETQFSSVEDFPFTVGTKVFVEGVAINEPEIGVTTRSYNSSDFEYKFFEIISTDPNIGGINANFTYSVSDFIRSDEILGIFNSDLSNPQVIPESYFPTFNSILKQNNFIISERIISDNSTGVVQNWNPQPGILIVASSDTFKIGSTLIGETSGNKSIIQDSTVSNGYYKISNSSDRRKGWKFEKGFLNDTFQRIHDNDYYQYFSYVVKSEIPLETWNDSVSSLNHTSGFKKFSTLEIPSSPDISSGISTNQNLGFIGAIQNLDSVIDLDCVFNFDLARENLITIGDLTTSNQIIFNSRLIQDYRESSGNRVLDIDNISEFFNSNPRFERFTVVNRKPYSDVRYVKYLVTSTDKLFSSESMFNIVSLIHDNSFTYINQYAKLFSQDDLGYFDARIISNNIELLYYPDKFSINDYHLNVCSFNLDETISGIGTLSLGDVVSLNTHTTTLPQGTSGISTIVSIGSTYRALKLHTLISDTDNNEYESIEINVIHDNTDVYITDYASLESNFSSSYGTGIGTFDASISGSNLIVSFTPNVSTASTYTINSLSIGIANTSATGVATETMSQNYIESEFIAISSSPSPSTVAISSFAGSDYNSAYYAVSIEDLTNSEYQFSEVVSLFNPDANTFSQVEYGIVNTSSNLGILSTGTIGSGVSEKVVLFFTPDANIDYEVRLFKFVFGGSTEYDFIDIETNKSEIQQDTGSYTGSLNDVKKSFNLTHNDNPIFKKTFDGTSTDYINLDEDTFLVTNHFFTTGEEVVYNQGGPTGSPIGISTTTIPGIGSTDILPSSVYVVKVNDLKIRVSGSATDALAVPPVYLDIANVGDGTNHQFNSKKQNTKALISIDNVIQSPVVATAKTTSLTADVTTLNNIVSVDDALQLSGGDLLKINDEIIKINVVNHNNIENNVLVTRSQLGTEIKNHLSGSIVRKVNANYNIADNIIYFADAPKGEVPNENPSDPEEVDFNSIKTSSTFSGRVFLKSGVEGTGITPYSNNYIFDSVSDQFNGIDDTFTIQSDGQDIIGISTNNGITLIRSVLQQPARSSVIPIQGSYDLIESPGITSITFTGDPIQALYDTNTSSVPRGGIIVSVGSSAGFGYQPLVSAGGTAIISGLGTVSSVSIGNSGSGYRVGIQTVNVGVATEISEVPTIQFIGTAVVNNGNVISVDITETVGGFISTMPPTIVFDTPLPYSNLPLTYSSSTPQSGVGTQATVNIQVSLDSSVLNFEIQNYGYSYKKDDILTVPINGLEGIPTDSSLSLQEFQVSIEETYEDEISSWHFGKIISIDPIDDLINGTRRFFPLKIDGKQTSFEAKPGSNLNLANNLIITINDVLQVPGESYVFNGGSVIEFTEAPQSFDDRSSKLTNVSTSKILFYEGTNKIDVRDVDILGTVKVGDTLRLDSGDQNLKEKSRIISEIISSDAVRTNVYSGKGISDNESLFRNAIWCKQRNDLFLSSASFVGSASSSRGFVVSKARESLSPSINPTAYLIKDLSISDNELFVDNLKTFFDSFDELGTIDDTFKTIKIFNQDNLVSCAATAVVSSTGTITSIEINESGVGYSTTPSVIISSPVGLGTTATGTATLSGSSVSIINLTNSGSGYTSSTPPSVLVEFPERTLETITKVEYEGDFGIITGIGTTSIVGVASTGIVFDLFIPENSFIRDSEITGSASTSISGIQTGYYFTIRNSNVGYGLTSLDESNNVIGIGSTFIDNVYRVSQVSIAQTTVSGVGTTSIAQVVVSVSDFNGLVSLGQTYYYGDYSWGRISNLTRSNPRQFDVYQNGISGIETSAIIQRSKSLKNDLYSS